MVSIDEVARYAGVSTATVSRALSGRGHVSDATRARVESAAKSLGYVVSSSASSLASGRTRNIGVLVPFLDRWFFSTVLSGTASALMRRGYDITLYNLTADRDHRQVELSKPLDLFVAELDRDRDHTVDPLPAQEGLEDAPALLAIGGPNPRLSTLTVDDTAVARLATEHLVALGHRDIAHIGASPEFDIDFHIPTHRRQGFEQALADAGIPVSPSLY
ncbi:MAG TPA: LacI family DNA-binding transcriptional regulator, partial [Microbacterium sp.]|nr:LacI family DNA-binding transcriptional regulator [Microbacterium sp.]